MKARTTRTRTLKVEPIDAILLPLLYKEGTIAQWVRMTLLYCVRWQHPEDYRRVLKHRAVADFKKACAQRNRLETRRRNREHAQKREASHGADS